MEIWGSIKRLFRQADHETANAIDVNDAEKGRQVIEDARKQVANFENQIACLMSSKKKKEKQRIEIQQNIDKFTNIANLAAKNNNRDDVRAAIIEKSKFEERLKTLDSEIKKDQELEVKFRQQLTDAKEKIDQSASKADSLKVRQESAKIRQDLSGSSINQNGSALSQLDAWEDKVEEAEAKAESMEELAGSGSVTQTLETKYQDTSAIDDEVEKLMASHSKATS